MFLNGTFSPLVKKNAVESEADCACAVDLHEKVAQLLFQSTSVQGLLKMAAMGQKNGFTAEKISFYCAFCISESSGPRSWIFPATFIMYSMLRNLH
jgi:hypothetical protein